MRERHQVAARPKRTTGNLSLLAGFLGRTVEDPRQLTSRDVGSIRAILAKIAAKRGLPGSEHGQAVRAAQARQGALPTRREAALAIAARLATRAHDGGLHALEPILAPAPGGTADVTWRQGRPARLASLRARLVRCLDAPVATLVEEGAIPSSEVLARVIPQITSQVAAASIADPDLRRLYGAIYAAFRQRRSLLLLDLERQAFIEELPWVAAIEGFRAPDPAGRDAARRTLEDVVLLALTSWPQTVLPNKLLREARALAGRAGLTLPLVDELAADIFAGTFTEKYLRAAQVAAVLLRGSIYETYYGIDYERVRAIDDVSRRGAPTSEAFADLCHRRAGVTRARSWWERGRVAENGKVIEQEQILTTHNLAVLVDRLALQDKLAHHVRFQARRTFTWVCDRLQAAPGAPGLRTIKNCAYAWRQMVFFLSLAPRTEVFAFLDWVHTQPAGFPARLRPAVAGLALAADGQTPGDDPGGRVFLGWTTGRHWLTD